MTRSSTPPWVSLLYRGAAVYGVLALVPLYFMAAPAERPESYYGFVGTALAFQFVFWVIGGDPVKHRAMMPFSVLEKLAFGVPCVLLFAAGRLATPTFAAGVLDLLLGLGFLLAWRATARR